MCKLVAVIVALTFACIPFGGGRTHAQTPISVTSQDTVNEFPRGVTFNLEFTSASPPKEVRLRYELAPDGTGASAVADCNGTSTITCSHTLVSGAGIFVIPGANITYHWDIEDEAGNKLSTEDELYVHEDTRFTFETVSEDNVTVYYHSGRLATAQAVLAAAIETIHKMSAIEQTSIDFPVKVFVYTTSEEMGPAIAPGGFGRGVSVLGEVVYSDTAMVSADVSTLDIARHEVTHIVTGQATKGPFGIPDWMNEGTSVFAQSEGLSGHDNALEAAIRSDNVLSMKELNSSSSGGNGATVGLYYGQAGSMISFLVETYGEEKFAELLRVFKEGSTPDAAFEQVYGFDQLGYENAWRASVGLDPRETPATATPHSTQAPPSTPTAEVGSEGGSSEDDGSTPVLTIAIIVALTALVLAAFGGLALVVLRRSG